MVRSGLALVLMTSTGVLMGSALYESPSSFATTGYPEDTSGVSALVRALKSSPVAIKIPIITEASIIPPMDMYL